MSGRWTRYTTRGMHIAMKILVGISIKQIFWTWSWSRNCPAPLNCRPDRLVVQTSWELHCCIAIRGVYRQWQVQTIWKVWDEEQIKVNYCVESCAATPRFYSRQPSKSPCTRQSHCNIPMRIATALTNEEGDILIWSASSSRNRQWPIWIYRYVLSEPKQPLLSDTGYPPLSRQSCSLGWWKFTRAVSSPNSAVSRTHFYSK